MSERMHALAQQIFGKSSVEQCALSDIRNLVQRYPYFAPAQFLLLEKLKQENSPEYQAQLQKAVLLYHNPLEFEYFISSDHYQIPEDPDFSPGAIETAEEKELVQELPEESLIATLPTTEEVKEEEPATEFIVPNQGPDEAGVQLIHEVPEQSQMDGLPATEEESTEASATEALIHNQEPDEVSGQFIREENETISGAMQEQVEESRPAEETGKSEQEVKEIHSMKAEPTEPVKEKGTNEPLAFEPFHTVDYFASQGIKLSQEEVPRDKFGKQLKSFTEWLKTMKRLPATEITASPEVLVDQKVEHLAQDSVHESNVVTEAMAEVWLKQGNRTKALEVYHKLSLLNPSKKAYFAAKIENLKRS